MQGFRSASSLGGLGVTGPTVLLWCDRVAATSELESLDVARRCELVQIACRRPDEQKVRFRDVWTRESLVEALRLETGVLLGVTEVGRILRAEGLRPHRTRYWRR